MNTNVLGRIGLDYIEACKKVGKKYSFGQESSMDLAPVLQVLKHCRIKENYAIYAYPPEYDGMSVPYAAYDIVRPLNSKEYPGITCVEELPDIYHPIDEAIEVDESPEGVWEAFLLWDLPRHLPCIQHGVYGLRDLLLDLDDYDKLASLSEFIDEGTGAMLEDKVNSFLKEIEGKAGGQQIAGYQSELDLRMALSLINCPLLLPKVDMGARRVYVTYWTNWTGLSRETLKFTRRGNSYGFLSLNQECLASYRWSIMV